MHSVYVASKFNNKIAVRKAYKKLKSEGFEIAQDWTKSLAKDLRDPNYIQKATKLAIEDTHGVEDCDLFILIDKQGGVGSYVELGMAIGLYSTFTVPYIYVITGDPKRTIFFDHPFVTMVDTIDEAITDFLGK